MFAGILPVALRKESVDRNMTLRHCTTYLNWSLSARRAWIEILPLDDVTHGGPGRSPQGERG